MLTKIKKSFKNNNVIIGIGFDIDLTIETAIEIGELRGHQEDNKYNRHKTTTQVSDSDCGIGHRRQYMVMDSTLWRTEGVAATNMDRPD